MSEFVEFTGKKTDPPKLYKCPKCKVVGFRYAKFFGSDGKLLTTDGKEPYFDMDRKPISNSGWLTDPQTKQIHECKGDNRGNTSESKTDVGHNSQTQLTDLDKKVRDRIIDDAYLSAKFLIWKLEGVEKACKELGIEAGAKSGMVFNQVCAEDRNVKHNGE